MTSSIYLIGTLHRDPKGQKRLERVLTKTDPDSLMVEGSERLYELVSKAEESEDKMLTAALKDKGYSKCQIDLIHKTLAHR